MTRKAARKRRKQAALQLVASTAAITGLLPASSSARGLAPAASGLLARAQTTAPASTTYRFEIPAGPFTDVLAAFERATGMHVTLAIESIGVIQSPGASGVLTAEQALQ